jgi:hypothetical protein
MSEVREGEARYLKQRTGTKCQRERLRALEESAASTNSVSVYYVRYLMS